MQKKEYSSDLTKLLLWYNLICWLPIHLLPGTWKSEDNVGNLIGRLSGGFMVIPHFFASLFLPYFTIGILTIILPLIYFKKLHPAIGIYLFSSLSFYVFIGTLYRLQYPYIL